MDSEWVMRRFISFPAIHGEVIILTEKKNSNDNVLYCFVVVFSSPEHGELL